MIELLRRSSKQFQMQEGLYWLRKTDDWNILSRREQDQLIESRGGEDFLMGAVKECVSQIIDVVVDTNELGIKPSFAELVKNLNIDKYHVNKVTAELKAMGYDEWRNKDEWECEICCRSELQIENRPCRDLLFPQYHKNWGIAKLCCVSCSMWENHMNEGAHTCSICGVFELMEDDDGDSLEGTFVVIDGREHEGHICYKCYLSEISTDEDDVYEDEYENEDLPENNGEKAIKIKDLVKEAGEVVYEIQEKISEGEYLKLMDLLQKITNETNSL